MAFVAIEGRLVHTSALSLQATTAAPQREAQPQCDACGSTDLIRVKACTRCRACGYKSDCNGW